MIDLSELGVSYYEIGGEIQTSIVSNVSTVVAVQDDPVVADYVDVRYDNPYGVCYAPAEQPKRHIPYSYGNPLVNMAANVLIRAVGPHEPEYKHEVEGPV